MTRSIHLDLDFGHALTLEKSATGATLAVRDPSGVSPFVVDIEVTPEGARVRVWGAGHNASPPVRASAWPSAEPRLSVQQYASLRADCMSVADDELDEVRQRYALDEASEAVETEIWRCKFAESPALFRTYMTLFRMFRSSEPPTSKSSSPSHGDGPLTRCVLSTAAIPRNLTLGEHATLAAELLHLPADEVYAKFGLVDDAVRAEVLDACEARLKDPQTLAQWKRLHAVVVERLKTSAK
jgi:hypothetical protein